jgi:hypothetical protein
MIHFVRGKPVPSWWKWLKIAGQRSTPFNQFPPFAIPVTMESIRGNGENW